MADIFGYNREVQEDTIVSADFAKITAKGIDGLVQQFNASYQRRIEPRFEVGSSDLYWVHGQPQGTISISKLVGSDGLIGEISDCGKLGLVSFNISGGGDCAPSGSGKAEFDGAMLQSVNLSANAGALEVTVGLQILFSTMTKS